MLRAIARGAPGTLWRRTYDVAAPGAGLDVSFPVPQHRVWQLLGVTVKLTASAVAGNRVPTLTLTDVGGIPLVRIPSPTAITATLAPIVSWTPGLGAAVVVPAVSAALTLPEAWYMMPQEQVQITGHTNAGDTWTQIRVTVIETNWGDPAYIDSIDRNIRDRIEALHELVT